MTVFLWSLVAGAAAQLASQSDIEIRSMPQWNCPHSTVTGGNTSCIAAVSSIQTFDFELVGLSQVYHSVQLWVAGSGGLLTQVTIGSISPMGASLFDKGRYYFRIPPNLHTGMSKLSITVLRGAAASVHPFWVGVSDLPDTFPVSMACGPGVFTRGCPCPDAGGPDQCSLMLSCDKMPVFETNICAGENYVQPARQEGFNPILLQTGSGVVVAYGGTPCVRRTECADCLADTRCSLCGTKCIDKGDRCLGRLATDCTAPPPAPTSTASRTTLAASSAAAFSTVPIPPPPTQSQPQQPASQEATEQPTDTFASDTAAAPSSANDTMIIAIAAGAGGGALLLVIVIIVVVCVLRKRRAAALGADRSGGAEISMSRYSSAPDAKPYTSSSSSSYTKPGAPSNQSYVYANHY